MLCRIMIPPSRFGNATPSEPLCYRMDHLYMLAAAASSSTQPTHRQLPVSAQPCGMWKPCLNPRAKSNEAADGAGRRRDHYSSGRSWMPPNVCQTYRHCRMQACGPASQFDWAGRVKMGSVDTRWSLSLTGQHRYLNAIESGYRVC